MSDPFGVLIMVFLSLTKSKEKIIKNAPLFKMYVDQTDIKAVKKMINRQNFWATGEEINQFEQELAHFVGRKYAVVFNSGTSALHTMLLAFGIKTNDEVVVPSFTFIATANSPLFVGAKPIFADIEATTYGLDIQSVKQKITNKTRAIMPIHYGGCACSHLVELKEFAEQKGLLFFEDVAQAYIDCLEAPIKDVKGEIFNIAPQNATINDVAEMVQKQISNTEVIIEKTQTDQRDYRVSDKKIRDTIGYKGALTIDDGIKEIKTVMITG